jgi:hypothetical protein
VDGRESILCPTLLRNHRRQATHIAELHKWATEGTPNSSGCMTLLKMASPNLSDLMLKDRITELKAIRDQARADTERAEGAIERQGTPSAPNRSRSLPERPSGCGTRADATAATIFVRSPSASKLMRKNFAPWGRKANCCAPSSPLQAQKRRFLACPVLYRSGASEEIRTPDSQLSSVRHSSPQMSVGE